MNKLTRAKEYKRVENFELIREENTFYELKNKEKTIKVQKPRGRNSVKIGLGQWIELSTQMQLLKTGPRYIFIFKTIPTPGLAT